MVSPILPVILLLRIQDFVFVLRSKENLAVTQMTNTNIHIDPDTDARYTHKHPPPPPTYTHASMYHAHIPL